MSAPRNVPAAREGEAQTAGAQACTADWHDTLDAYRRAQCRCPSARRQAARYEQERTLDILYGKPRTLSNVGALRRVQALRALGWSIQELAARIGVHERSISRWNRRQWISRDLHETICRVYDELADQRGPDERARRHAARQGWLVPLWWDDDTIDDPTFDPLVEYADEDFMQHSSSREVRRSSEAEIVADLTEKGLSAREIAERLAFSERRVVRLRSLRRAAETTDVSDSAATISNMQRQAS